jgi:hypothetical protein
MWVMKFYGCLSLCARRVLGAVWVSRATREKELAGRTRVTGVGSRIDQPRRQRCSVYPTAGTSTSKRRTSASAGTKKAGNIPAFLAARQRVVKPNGRFDVSAIST